MSLEQDRILRGPNIRFPEQHLGFRTPETPLPAPSWCTGLRAGSLPGGGLPNPNVYAQWFRNFADPDDQFAVQLIADDVIVGVKVRRGATRLECSVKSRDLHPAQARKMAAALTEAADLIDA